MVESKYKKGQVIATDPNEGKMLQSPEVQSSTKREEGKSKREGEEHTGQVGGFVGVSGEVSGCPSLQRGFRA